MCTTERSLLHYLSVLKILQRPKWLGIAFQQQWTTSDGQGCLVPVYPGGGRYKYNWPCGSLYPEGIFCYQGHTAFHSLILSRNKSVTKFQSTVYIILCSPCLVCWQHCSVLYLWKRLQHQQLMEGWFSSKGQWKRRISTWKRESYYSRPWRPFKRKRKSHFIGILCSRPSMEEKKAQQYRTWKRQSNAWLRMEKAGPTTTSSWSGMDG
jgi:hypothetical protein